MVQKALYEKTSIRQQKRGDVTGESNSSNLTHSHIEDGDRTHLVIFTGLSLFFDMLGLFGLVSVI